MLVVLFIRVSLLGFGFQHTVVERWKRSASNFFLFNYSEKCARGVLLMSFLDGSALASTLDCVFAADLLLGALRTGFTRIVPSTSL
jgi:hypothetical protein